MINIDPTVLVIMGEVILAMLVAMGGAILYMLKGKKRDRAAVAELEARLKKNASKRQEWYESVLTDSIESGDVDANRELAATWVEKENQFYAQLIEMYMKRNTTALRGLDKLLHEYTSSYLELVSLMRTRIDEEQGAIPADAKEKLERLVLEGERLSGVIKALEEDNVRLNDELKAANNEIDQAMREYSVAFRPGSGMTGSAGPAATEAEASGVELEAMPEPELALDSGPPAEMSAETDEPLPEAVGDVLGEPLPEVAESLSETDDLSTEEIGVELEELTSEIIAEAGDIAATDESGLVEEVDLAEFDQILAPEEISPETVVEEPAELGGDALAALAAAKGAVIDLADEGEIILPELNELVAAVDEKMEEELLAGDELPVLDESLDSDMGEMLDEDGLLAQLEGLDEIELPPFSSDMVMDEMSDLTPPPAKGEDSTSPKEPA